MKPSLPYQHSFKIVTVPADASGGITGLRTKLQNHRKIIFHVAIGAGTAGTFTFTLKQHDAASLGNSKVISINGAYYVKYSSATKFTKVDIPEGSEASAFTLGTPIGANKAELIFEVDAEQLDVSNAYYWASLDAAAVGQTRIVSVVAILQDSAFKPAYDVDLA